MVDKLKKIPSRRIIAGTAVALVVLFIVSGLFAFATESSARKTAALPQSICRLKILPGPA